MAYLYSQTTYRPCALWEHSGHGSVPPNNPVIGGNDVNGEPIYIGRAVQSDDLIPGKVVPSHGVCYVPWDGRENSHHSYQVLTNPHRCPLVWVGGQHDGNVPPGALQGGRQADGTPLFIGRSFHNGSMVVGKVHPGHGVLYVPFDGQEVPIHSNYEVLVCKEILF